MGPPHRSMQLIERFALQVCILYLMRGRWTLQPLMLVQQSGYKCNILLLFLRAQLPHPPILLFLGCLHITASWITASWISSDVIKFFEVLRIDERWNFDS